MKRKHINAAPYPSSKRQKMGNYVDIQTNKTSYEPTVYFISRKGLEIMISNQDIISYKHGRLSRIIEKKVKDTNWYATVLIPKSKCLASNNCDELDNMFKKLDLSVDSDFDKKYLSLKYDIKKYVIKKDLNEFFGKNNNKIISIIDKFIKLNLKL